MFDNDSCDVNFIAVPVIDRIFCGYNDIADLPRHYFDEIQHFFQVYKSLESGKVTSVTETNGVEMAKDIIKKSIDSYIKDFQMA